MVKELKLDNLTVSELKEKVRRIIEKQLEALEVQEEVDGMYFVGIQLYFLVKLKNGEEFLASERLSSISFEEFEEE